MEKEKLLSTLTEKLGKTSFSSKTIETYLDLNPLPEGAEPDDGYWQKAVAFIKGMQGQFNHDVAEAVSKHTALPKENKNEVNEVKSEVSLPNEINEILKKIQDENKELRERFEQQDKQRAADTLRERVADGMRAKNASNAYVLRNVLRDAELDPSKSVDELVSECLQKYDVELREVNPTGFVPRESVDGSQKTTAFDGYFKRKAEREGWSKEK